ncbi:MAG: hypothetical protein CMK09_09095 [Ponticaulis sp.]|nr:hypothetical protein [Ponticaulis sp.]|tara:strand:- start:45457 stop:46026 length:570 start_codon:yes stop_codon:yes gene_type:complete
MGQLNSILSAITLLGIGLCLPAQPQDKPPADTKNSKLVTLEHYDCTGNKTKTPTHYWFPLSGDREVLSESRTYKTKAGALKGFASVCANGSDVTHFGPCKPDEKGRSFLILAEDGKESCRIIGRSKSYNAEEGSKSGNESVRKCIKQILERESEKSRLNIEPVSEPAATCDGQIEIVTPGRLRAVPLPD